MSALPWETRDYVYVSAECLTGVLSALGNGLVLLAIWRTRALRTVTNCFIGSLAAADTLVGIIVPPTVILPYRGLPTEFFGCVFLNTVVLLITNISILNLLAVALERFLAISNPFRYQRLMTVRRAMCVVIFTWVVAILLGLIPTMGWYKGRDGFTVCSFTQVIDMEYMVYLIFFGVNLPPLFFMLVIYLYIFHIIRQQHRRTTAQLTVLSRDERRSARQQKREVRGAKGLAYVIILFAVCWMPLHVLNCITLFAPEKSPEYPWLLAAIVLSHANSFVNPFLYAFSNSQFKRAMKRIIFCGHFQPSYSSDSSEGVSRSRTTRVTTSRSPEVINNNGSVYTDPVANGHASTPAGEGKDHLSDKAQQAASSQDNLGGGSSSDNNGGMVNEAFDSGTESHSEISRGYPRNPKKSLRWSENVETIPAVSPGNNNNNSSSNNTPQNLQSRGSDSGLPPEAPNEVWVTSSSRSLEMRNLSKGSATASSLPRTQNGVSSSSLSAAASLEQLPKDDHSDGTAQTLGDAADGNDHSNGLVLTLEDVTNGETVDAVVDVVSHDDHRTKSDETDKRNVTGASESESFDNDVVIDVVHRTPTDPHGSDHQQMLTNVGGSVSVPQDAEPTAAQMELSEEEEKEKKRTRHSPMPSARSTEEEEGGAKEYALGSKRFISVRL